MSDLPIAIIGAGPVGLAAAANMVERGMTPVILEAGERVAASMWDWGHVRLFTEWSYLIDPASERLLQANGSWTPPDPHEVPLAAQVVEHYLDPLARLDSIAPHIRLQHRVIAVGREGHDRMKDGNPEDRSTKPYLIVVDTPDGRQRLRARAVIDASGTWSTPNPIGAGGVQADGEQEFAANIRYGIPDVLGKERQRYAGKRILVVGSGHSAIGSILNLATLSKESDTLVAWAIRGKNPRKLWGGGAADQLEARGALGTKVRQVVVDGDVTLMTELSIGALRKHPEGLAVIDVDGAPRVVVDEIIVATGARPDHQMLRELRTDFDVATEASKILGPMIDPNHHSCGSVKPHGAAELAHPEKDFYIVGMKSYGRAPTFLLMTGYEQVRSVVALLDGDHPSAAKVELTLPQTGVCSTDRGYGGTATPGRCC